MHASGRCSWFLEKGGGGCAGVEREAQGEGTDIAFAAPLLEYAVGWGIRTRVRRAVLPAPLGPSSRKVGSVVGVALR